MCVFLMLIIIPKLLSSSNKFVNNVNGDGDVGIFYFVFCGDDEAISDIYITIVERFRILINHFEGI